MDGSKLTLGFLAALAAASRARQGAPNHRDPEVVEEEYFYVGYRRGYRIAEDTDWPDDEWSDLDDETRLEMLIAWAYEAEASNRSYTPFEFLAKEINESEYPDETWQAFDDGIAEGIEAGAHARLGLPCERSRRLERYLQGPPPPPKPRQPAPAKKVYYTRNGFPWPVDQPLYIATSDARRVQREGIKTPDEGGQATFAWRTGNAVDAHTVLGEAVAEALMLDAYVKVRQGRMTLEGLRRALAEQTGEDVDQITPYMGAKDPVWDGVASYIRNAAGFDHYTRVPLSMNEGQIPIGAVGVLELRSEVPFIFPSPDDLVAFGYVTKSNERVALRPYRDVYPNQQPYNRYNLTNNMSFVGMLDTVPWPDRHEKPVRTLSGRKRWPVGTWFYDDSVPASNDYALSDSGTLHIYDSSKVTVAGFLPINTIRRKLGLGPRDFLLPKDHPATKRVRVVNPSWWSA